VKPERLPARLPERAADPPRPKPPLAADARPDRDGQRVGQLAGHTSIEVSTLSRLIGTMEAKGLARRERAAADDARAVTVHMTERGRELAERIVPVALYYEEVALRGLTEAEADTLKGLLRRVYDNMTALDEAPQAARQPAEARRRA